MKSDDRQARQVARLEGELDDLEKRLEAQYTQMGRRLAELMGSEERAVNRLVDEIVRKKRQLARAKCERQCAACLALNPAGSQFCRQCGAQLGAAPPRDRA